MLPFPNPPHERSAPLAAPPLATLVALSGIPAPHWQRLLTCLASDPRIEQAWLFGSRAKGTWQEGSDIDLAVWAPAWQAYDLTRMLTALDGLDLPWSIDLVNRARLANTALDAHIERVGIPLLPFSATQKQAND
ncbi:nucleotidyltransferase family protein [Hydrogenophilus thiooxidans]|uniref:nucleotidyltransferase family protein n=1 Tax=Hydrogenophilus thiooxidans TaxID=2820326 RepID=UPI001C249063|nr:nucleotidyltransferase domain-containing protein [Hydrogenophilus thiooxidans]